MSSFVVERLFVSQARYAIMIFSPALTSWHRVIWHKNVIFFAHAISGQEAILLRVMNDREIEQEEDTSTLFRSSTMATCLMDQYMKVTLLSQF